MRRSIVSVLLITMTASAAGHTQRRRIVLTPFAGGYVPTTKLGPVEAPGPQGGPTILDGQMVTSTVLGGRLAYWTSERFAVEGTYFYSTSDLRVTAGVLTATFDAQIQGGSVKAMYRLTDGMSGADFVVNAGAGAVRPAGQVFEETGNATTLAGVIGTGLMILLSSQADLRLDAELMAHRWRTDARFPSKTQLDIFVTVGLALRLSP